MSGQLLRISDFERDSEMQGRVVKRGAPGRVCEFPTPVRARKKRSSGRAWRRGLDMALRIELGGLLLLALAWLVWHLIP
jgi:hypothetical protein